MLAVNMLSKCPYYEHPSATILIVSKICFTVSRQYYEHSRATLLVVNLFDSWSKMIIVG